MRIRNHLDRPFLAALVLFAYGGFEMTAGIISGEMNRVLSTYDFVMQIAAFTLAGVSIVKLWKGD